VVGLYELRRASVHALKGSKVYSFLLTSVCPVNQFLSQLKENLAFAS